MAMDLRQTRVTVHRLRGTIPRAIACQERRAVKKDQRFQGLAALEWPEDGPQHGAERLQRHRIEALAHSRVTRDVGHAVEGGSMTLKPLFVKGEEGW